MSRTVEGLVTAIASGEGNGGGGGGRKTREPEWEGRPIFAFYLLNFEPWVYNIHTPQKIINFK